MDHLFVQEQPLLQQLHERGQLKSFVKAVLNWSMLIPERDVLLLRETLATWTRPTTAAPQGLLQAVIQKLLSSSPSDGGRTTRMLEFQSVIQAVALDGRPLLRTANELGRSGGWALELIERGIDGLSNRQSSLSSLVQRVSADLSRASSPAWLSVARSGIEPVVPRGSVLPGTQATALESVVNVVRRIEEREPGILKKWISATGAVPKPFGFEPTRASISTWVDMVTRHESGYFAGLFESAVSRRQAWMTFRQLSQEGGIKDLLSGVLVHAESGEIRRQLDWIFQEVRPASPVVPLRP
jgi:hypothetical protein